MKILIIGSRGYIGKNIQELLKRRGNEIKECDVKNTRSCRQKNLSKVVSEEGIKHYDAIIHLACESNINFNYKKTEFCIRNNIEELCRVLDFLDSSNFNGKFVYFSSSAIYANQDGIYKFTKKMSEEMVRNKLDNYYIIRPFNVIGGYIKDKTRNDHIIPKMCRAYKMNDEFCIYGSGKERRSYIHIDRILSLIILILGDYIEKKSVIDVGGNKMTDVKSVIKIFENIVNSRLIKKYVGDRVENPKKIQPDKSADYIIDSYGVEDIRKAIKEYLDL